MKSFFVNLCLILFMTSCSPINHHKEFVVATEDFFVPDSMYNREYQQPHLFIKDKSIDFGKVNQKNYSNIKIKLPYANTGKNQLILFHADVSCSCLSVSLPKEPLKHKQIDTLNISINPRKVSGHFIKYIFIKSNADNDIEVVHIKGLIEN